MAISEQWIPIVSSAVSWVKDNFGPTKKELKVQVADLEKQVQALAKGNAAIVNNMSLILQAVLSKIKSDNNYLVNAETIVYVGTNNGTLDIPKTSINSSYISKDTIVQKQVVKNDFSKDFFVSDEEIALTRTIRPSERR